MHPADIYLKIRKHVFSTYRKLGLNQAFKIIDGYHSKNEIDDKHYIGIRAELGFFGTYHKKLMLWESLDSGNHADFIGIISGNQY